MQRKNLSANQVVTTCKALGDGKGSLSAVGVEDLGTPGGDSSGVSVLCDLEKGAGCGGLCVADLGHVDEDGAVVVTADSGVRA